MISSQSPDEPNIPVEQPKPAPPPPPTPPTSEEYKSLTPPEAPKPQREAPVKIVRDT